MDYKEKSGHNNFVTRIKIKVKHFMSLANVTVNCSLDKLHWKLHAQHCWLRFNYIPLSTVLLG